MARPRLRLAMTWEKYERAVLAVFAEALGRLAEEPTLPRKEPPINYKLYWLCRQVKFEHGKAKDRESVPFSLLYDTQNQPELDDAADAARLNKRPDFSCVMTDEQAPDYRSAQINYSLECKRVGKAETKWVLNENYSQRGMLRFMEAAHGYAKGCSSAAMIGYLKDSDPDDVLGEVNGFAAKRNVPSLRRAAEDWAEKNVTELSQDPLTRDFDSKPMRLHHLWIDLRHCTFEDPAPKPKAAGVEKPAKSPRKKAAKKRRPKKPQ